MPRCSKSSPTLATTMRLSGLQDPAQAQRKLGAADASGERNHEIPAHRKRSSFGGRTRLAAVDSGADQLKPRMRTAGQRLTRLTHQERGCGRHFVGEADDADLELSAEQVGAPAQIDRRGQTRDADRNANGSLAPGSAKAVVDDDGEIGLRPRFRDRGAAPRRLRPAFPVRRRTRWKPSAGPTFDWSTPAFAMMKPSLCSTIRTPRRARTMRTDSDRMTSTSRGSLSISAASFSALAEGSIVARSTTRPSAFDTIFCATTSTSLAPPQRRCARSPRR